MLGPDEVILRAHPGRDRGLVTPGELCETTKPLLPVPVYGCLACGMCASMRSALAKRDRVVDGQVDDHHPAASALYIFTLNQVVWALDVCSSDRPPSRPTRS